MKLKLFFFSALTAIGLTLPSNIFAGNLTVRLGQPKTPTNQNNIKLTFVALEIGGSDNITVRCYKKSPSDSDYVKFDEDKILIPGGNTDYCSVDSSILSTSGTYSFKVIANGTLESNIATVAFNNSGPSTPVSYSKEKISDCDYKIKFKTADDSKTVRVELFRNDTNSIPLDSGHRVASPSIAPNTEGEITNSVPVCSKEYFYVLRAVDNSDNVSDTIGDRYTTTTSTTTTSTTGTTQPAIAIGSGSQVNGENPAGTSEGTITAQTNGEGTPSASVTPAVLGTKNTKNENLRWLAIPLILIAAFFFLKSRKRA